MGLDLFDKLFIESKQNKKLIYIEKYSGGVSFCGYVLSYNSKAVQIQHFTRYGKNDGVINILYSDIKYITTDNEYLKAMQYIIDNNGFADEYKNSVLPLQTSGDWIQQVLEEYKGDKSSVLGIQVCDDWYIGFVEDLDDIFVSFTELDKNGMVIDTSIYKVNDISSIHVNELEGRKRLKLYNWRKKL